MSAINDGRITRLTRPEETPLNTKCFLGNMVRNVFRLKFKNGAINRDSLNGDISRVSSASCGV